MRKLRAYLLLLGIVVLYPFGIYFYVALTKTSQRVLVVGDFSPQGFGYQVLVGIQAADLGTAADSKLDVVRVDQREFSGYPEPWRSRNLRAQVLKELGDSPTLAIIAATTSGSTAPILEASRAFNVPVVLAVATNDSLTKRPDFSQHNGVKVRARRVPGDDPLVIRLPPNDGKQADKMFGWLQKNAKPSPGFKPSPVVVAYENSLYGSFLYQRLRERCVKVNRAFLTWQFASGSRMHDLIQLALKVKARTIVFIGYYSEAQDMLINAQALSYKGLILLSDGAYSTELFTKRPIISQVYISQPNDPSLKMPGGVRGFGMYGHDAYVLLNSARRAMNFPSEDLATGSQDLAFIGRIKHTVDLLEQSQPQHNLIGTYKFPSEESAENASADFHVVACFKGTGESAG